MRSAEKALDLATGSTSLRLVLGIVIITLLSIVSGALVGLNYVRARSVAIGHVG